MRILPEEKRLKTFATKICSFSFRKIVSTNLLVFTVVALSLGLGVGPSLSSVANAQTTSTRKFYMGFTQPHFSDGDAAAKVWGYLKTSADLVVIHHDGTVPWEAASSLTNENIFFGTQESPNRYPIDYDNDVAGVANLRAQNPNQKVVLYLNMLNMTRNGIALCEGCSTQGALTWNTLAKQFDDYRVVSTYIKHVQYLVARLRPDYILFGIEHNMMIDAILQGVATSDNWNRLLSANRQIYSILKTWNPNIPLGISIQADLGQYHYQAANWALLQIFQTSDLVALSAYPYLNPLLSKNLPVFPDPTKIPADYFSKFKMLAPTKPFAFAETGWTSQSISFVNSNVVITSNDSNQSLYMRRVLYEVARLGGVYINNFASRDYDQVYDYLVSVNFFSGPNASMQNPFLAFKDIGIVNRNDVFKAAATPWYLAFRFNFIY